MTDVADEDRTTFLANMPADRGACGLAAAVIVISTFIFMVLAPFAKVLLTPLPAFIAVYESAQLINDLITAVFLIGQSRLERSNALTVLAGAYLFTAVMSGVHALSFPGLFAPAGLLGAGPQSTAWLYMAWHSGFPLFVIAYAGWRPRQEEAAGSTAVALGTVAVAVAAACACTLVATRGEGLLPEILHDNHYTPAATVTVSGIWLLNLLALFVLARRRPISVLDLWLVVTMFAWLFDIALSAGLNAGRYDLGFYAGRIYGLLAASFVLIVLLSENARLYVQLARLRDSERTKTAELERLSTTDPLTGIANRRAFDAALGQEWRRMMRHKTALSLLMIDVDCFKRFNDSYGHVGGDECLRAVAQTIAGRVRRAGELAARYGGEEFAVLLPQADIGVASRLAALICDAVRERRIPHEASTAAPYLTVSIGVACIADVPKTLAALSRDNPATSLAGPTLLVEAADQALYRAKTAGRNRFAVAGPDDADAAASGPAAAAVVPIDAE
jgi:diguanylate cyclase (GGDEF)-like protein